MGQAVHLLRHPVSGERLEGLDDSGMEDAPALLGQVEVGHLVGEGMREGGARSGKRRVS
jgi:hypothetical protein